MDIYVVQYGDNIESIAEKYGIAIEKIISDNGLINPYSLVVGQSLVILYPIQTYTVEQDDTLENIADTYGISIMQLLRNNPFLFDREYIYPGDSLVIKYNTVNDIQVNGYAYVFLSKDILKRALPYLTYISIYNYRISTNADIISYDDDTDIINMAKAFGTAPLLMISSYSQTGDLNIEHVYELLLRDDLQDKLVDNMLQLIKTKEYSGLNFLISHITEYNQALFINFFSKISRVLRNDGRIFMVTISPDYQNYDRLDYTSISLLVDRIIFLQNTWEINKQPPAPISNISLIKPFMEYVTGLVSPDKLSLGKPLIGYDWNLPFTPGSSSAKIMSLNSTIFLAYDQRTVIQLDEESQTPYFEYVSPSLIAPEHHIVWFVDARSIKALDDVIIDYGLVGTGLWNITSYNQEIFSMINAVFSVIKLPNL